MQNTPHQTLITRLNMWRVFFTTGVDTAPLGEAVNEHDIPQLIEQAHATDVPHIIELAELVDLMAENYMRRMDLDEAFKELMPVSNPNKLSMMEELDAALAGA